MKEQSEEKIRRKVEEMWRDLERISRKSRKGRLEGDLMSLGRRLRKSHANPKELSRNLSCGEEGSRYPRWGRRVKKGKVSVNSGLLWRGLQTNRLSNS